ncbi:MAG: pyridoxamine 5'-phosphate oxidase family protein [Actinomycetota bacterium]
MSLSMTKAEREAFLADLHVGVLGVNHGEVPLAVPIWYDYEPGGDIWVLTSPESIKGRALAASGRFSLCAQTEAPPYRYVTVEGTVASVEDPTTEDARHMAHRYLGPELGDAYVEATADESTSKRYRLTPQRWYTVDYAKQFA